MGDGLDQNAEDAAAALARSGALGSAIQARLNSGDLQGANALFTEVQDRLDPVHAAPLQGQFDAVFAKPLPYRPSIDGADIKAVPLPYRPPTDGALDVKSMLQNLANVPDVQSTADRGEAKIVPVNGSREMAEDVGSGPLVAQAKLQGPSVVPGTPQDQDAAGQARQEQKQKERAQVFDGMARRTVDDFPSYPRPQAPLSEDWRSDINKIDPTYVGILEKIGKKYGISPELLARQFFRESNFDMRKGSVSVNGRYVAVNLPHENDGPVGISQMRTAAAKDVGTTREALVNGTAESQIEAGAKYLSQQYKRFGSWPKAVAAYHSGYPAMANWFGGRGPDYQVTKSASWRELERYLPYVFMGDPERYDSGYEHVPEYP